MAFWKQGFWKTGFWKTGFWKDDGDVEPSEPTPVGKIAFTASAQMIISFGSDSAIRINFSGG